MNIGMHGHMIIGKIPRSRQPGYWIVNRLFFERHTDAHNDTAENLTAAGFRINDADAIHHAYPTRHADQWESGIDFHLAKMCAEALKAEFFILSEFKFHFFNGQPNRIGADLRKCGISAGAEIVRSATDKRGAV